ncbi:uncharacterized protein LOC131437543 isoform X2 [Malaya genurostris]|uniref:uncharacterized protein LOC131437543 isoform X2 n=1 Tax=Malaya genurostris TaxID=325434 RepID=UPI0026F39E50|nr:uncharacterized protein LOC131437543 isoform X2 [Malaya genurostris]
MGNSHSSKSGSKATSPVIIAPNNVQQNPAGNSSNNTTKGMSRTASGADLQDRSQTPNHPVEKLGKILVKKCDSEYGINGITAEVFARYVFPKFPEVGKRLFNFLRYNSRAKTDHMGLTAFRQQCEKFLGVLDDSVILESYVKMFGNLSETDLIKPEDFKNLLNTCYNLAMAHYQDGPQTCLLLNRTLNSVVQSCFFSKESLSSGYICRWLENNVPRLVPPLHKYCVHALSTSHRNIIDSSMTNNSDTVVSIRAIAAGEASYGLELQTPILEKGSPCFKPNATTSNGLAHSLSEKTRETMNIAQPLLPISEAWLLAGALPPTYSKPQSIQPPINSTSSNLASQVFMAKLLSMVPSHWTMLYDSRLDGAGTNRFLHHVLGYRGPNLILFRCDDDLLFCVANANEWRETHLYFGSEDSCCLQLLPKFVMLEKKTKSLYLNTHIRGYPKGLRAGSDPRKPILIVNEHFEKLEHRGLQHTILSIEVWGCGDQQQRDIQLDIKKWQIKEAERQRTVKLTAADWMDHPDRYLLELGGRQNYNNSSS